MRHDLLQFAEDLQRLGTRSLSSLQSSNTTEQLAEIASGMQRSADRLTRLKDGLAAEASIEGLRQRAEGLCRWFSMTPEMPRRFKEVMEFFRARDLGVSLPLDEVISALGWKRAADSGVDAVRCRQELEHFKDVGMLVADKTTSGWMYSISAEAIELIDKGMFAPLGLAAKATPPQPQ